MGRAALLAIAIALGLTALGGCSLLTSLDGLSGPPALDATIDGAVAETGMIEAGADSGPIDPCAGAILCDDFERDDVQGNWKSVYTDNGGTAAVSSAIFTSATRSLMLHVPSSPAGGDPHAQLGSVDYADVAHVRVAFSLKVGTADRVISLMRLQLLQFDRNEVFDLYMLPGKLIASEEGSGAANAGYFEYTVPSGFLPGVWQRWTLELDARINASTGIVTLDGKEVIRTTLHNAYTKSALRVLLGAFYAPNGPPHDVFYDDVSITILP